MIISIRIYFSMLLAILPFWVVSGAAVAQTPISREISDNVSIVSDQQFAQYGDLVLELDLYRPLAPKERLPMIILVQGGGAANGSKETFGPIAAKFAKQGFAAISIDYRGFREALFPATVVDVQKAIDWLVERQDDYLLNAEQIGIFGGSYGGLIALHTGLISNNTDVWQSSQNIDAIVGFSAISDLSGFESIAGFGEQLLGVSRSEDPQRWTDASPINRVTVGSPPLLLVASATDTTVQSAQSDSIAKRYRETGVEVNLHILPDAHHAFWNYTEWFDETISLATDFYRKHLMNPEAQQYRNRNLSRWDYVQTAPCEK